ncbi:MAG: hypothetical protein JO337_02070 [Acidimicrobiales bacterium]|nr:hypothetical protein [Acidimicrobiales bacterium]
MSWAVTMEGRSDPGGIVLLFDDRSEAESIAHEIRTRGTSVVVKSYPGPGAPANRPTRPQVQPAPQ